MDNLPPTGRPFRNGLPLKHEPHKNGGDDNELLVERKVPKKSQYHTGTDEKLKERREIRKRPHSSKTSRAPASQTPGESPITGNMDPDSASASNSRPSLLVQYERWKLLFAQPLSDQDELSEIYDYYSTSSDSEEKLELPERVIVRKPDQPKLSRNATTSLRRIQNRLKLSVDFAAFYSRLLVQSPDFSNLFPEETGLSSSELKESLTRLGEETFAFMTGSGIERYANDPDLPWPWVPEEKLTREDYYYIEHVTPSIKECQDIVYGDKINDLTLQEKDWLYNKLTAFIIHHTKQAFCGDSAHVAMNYLLYALKRDRISVRIAFIEMQVFPRSEAQASSPKESLSDVFSNNNYHSFPPDSEDDVTATNNRIPSESSHDSGYSDDRAESISRQKRLAHLHLNTPDSTQAQGRTRKPNTLVTPVSAKTQKSISEDSPLLNASKGEFIANHIAIAILPRNKETLKLPRQVTSATCLHSSESIIIDPDLKIIQLADNPSMTADYLEAFNLKDTGNFLFQYTFLY